MAAINRRQLDVGWDVIGIYQEAARSDERMGATLRDLLAAREGEIRRLLLTMQDDFAPGVNLPRALDVTLALLNLEAYLAGCRAVSPETVALGQHAHRASGIRRAALVPNAEQIVCTGSRPPRRWR